MKQILKLCAFVLILIGTVGLLINEFVFGWGRATVLTFAVINFIGLAALAYANWGRKPDHRP